MDLTIVIPVYNRPDYLRQTLDSIYPLIGIRDWLILSDDGSTDPEVSEVIKEFLMLAKANLRSVTYHRYHNAGVHVNMLRALEECRYSTAIVTLDSDFIVADNFLIRLREAIREHANEDTIITGFNAPAHPILRHEAGYVIKRTFGGGNLAFTWEAYKKHIRPSLTDTLWDWKMCASVNRSGGKLICLTPSICQHIGIHSTLGHEGADVAIDFKMVEV